MPKPPAPLESFIQHEILHDLANGENYRMYRQNTGAAKDASGRVVKFGQKGQADLWLILGTTIRCPACHVVVLERSGRYMGVEVKRPGEKPEQEQVWWGETIERHGGIYAVVTSKEQARHEIEKYGGVVRGKK